MVRDGKAAKIHCRAPLVICAGEEGRCMRWMLSVVIPRETLQPGAKNFKWEISDKQEKSVHRH